MLKQPGWSSKVLPVSWAGPTDVLDLLLNSWFTLLVLVPRKGKVICWSDCEQRHDKLGTLLGTQVSISKWTLSTFSGVLQIYLPLKWAWGWTLVLELLSVDAVWLWHSSSLICCSPQSWEEYVGHCPSLACTAVFFFLVLLNAVRCFQLRSGGSASHGLKSCSQPQMGLDYMPVCKVSLLLLALFPFSLVLRQLETWQ